MNVDFSQINQLVDQYVDEYINLNELNERLNYGTNNFIITMIKQDLLNTVIVLINQMKITDFKIIGNEVEVKRDYSNFKFSGIVDRVDQYDKYLKIIDYKSSNKDLDISLAIQGFNIQILLYLDTLTNQMKLEKGALLYFNTKKRILASTMKINETESANNFFKLYKMNGYVNEEVIEEIDNQIDKESSIIKAKFVKKDDCYKGNILSSYSFERLLAYVNKHIEKLYQEILSGKISINPKGSDDTTTHNKINPCTYCKYQSLCNYDVFYNEHTLVDNNNLEYLIKEDVNNAD
ncbi:PD-(D/E)XK nuclease family protein [Thomasclavelia cocleata]|nr:PD-(D/E)XK nuclease family protein [Thomasclavelia cocleata]